MTAFLDCKGKIMRKITDEALKTAINKCGYYYSIDTIRAHTRRTMEVDARRVVANLLYSHGYDCFTISRAMNRDRTAVLRFIGKVKRGGLRK